MLQLLHFTADWCQPCKQMEPIIAKFISNNVHVDYVKVNVTDGMEEEYSHYGVQGIPTFISLVDGIEKVRHTGVASEEKLSSLFN